MASIAWNRTRVSKKFLPAQPGARKLARRYGDALVCVRYRHDPEGTVRYTTVELVIDETPVVKRPPRNELMAVRLARDDVELRRQLLAHGAKWDMARRVWWTTRGVVLQLRLLERVVEVDDDR